MSGKPSVVVLGGGLSGAAAAWALAKGGFENVTLVESGERLGGLAGSFEQDGRFYPLGYHHVLHRDRTLLEFLGRIGALPEVRWRRVHVAFFEDGRLHDLSSPLGFARFPMPLADKARFARLMLRAFRKSDWSDWEGRSAAELVDEWASPGVRRAVFEPLSRIRFELPCERISAAWLGARLHHREGSARLGYIPGTNWTRVLCDGVARLVEEAGVRVLLRSPVFSLRTGNGRLREAALAGGGTIGADLFVSTLPTETWMRLIGSDATPGLAAIRYSALVSVVCAAKARLDPDLYWVSLTGPGRTACGIFNLSALNPTIGGPGEICVNFVSHLRDRDRPLFAMPDEQLVAAYLSDFRTVFGFDIEPAWTRVNRVAMYSPLMLTGFSNPPIRSASWENVYFAGNYRTFPSVLSTGTALASGVETAGRLEAEHATGG